MAEYAGRSCLIIIYVRTVNMVATVRCVGIDGIDFSIPIIGHLMGILISV